MRKKRLVTFVTIVAIIISCFGSTGTFANALENTIEPIADETMIIMPRYVAIIAISNNLTLNSGRTLTCYGSTTVQPAYKAGVKIELQQKNGSWSTIQTWDETSTTFTKIIEEDKKVEPGTYRLKLTHTAKNSDGSVKETDTDYSKEVVVS